MNALRTSEPPVLSVGGLTCLYSNGVGVRDISVDVAEGEMLVLLGPSGCGKTTLLRSIAGLNTPSAGSIRLRGEEAIGRPTNKRNIGMVFQTWALFPHLTVRENVAFGLKMQRTPKAEARRIVDESLDLVGLGEYAEKRPANLSGGQQQRVALARAIASRPQLMLFDEPLSSLDLKIRLSLQTELKQVQRSLGLTGVYVTHDHSEAFALGDMVAVMREGRIIEMAPPRELFSKPRYRFTAEFLSSSNVIPVRLDGPASARTATTEFGASFPIDLAPGEGVVSSVSLPYHAVRILPAGAEAPDALAAEIATVDYRATGTQVTFRLPGASALIAATLPANAGVGIGETMRLAFDWDQAVPLIDDEEE